MRFMMLMIPKGYEKATPGTMPDAKAVAAARVSFSAGKPKVTDGPFSEAKEVPGGYWMIQVSSKEEAIKWAR